MGDGTASVTVHDYTASTRGWGHDYVFRPVSNGLTGTAQGWGRGIRRGDVIALAGPHGGASYYGVESISYYSDPEDMWEAALTYTRDPDSFVPVSDESTGCAAPRG